MKVELKTLTTPYRFVLPGGHVLFRIEEATLSHELFNGKMSPDITRVNFERGDGVGVLLYAADTDEVVLIEQFRYPVYASDPEGDRQGRGWILEIVAGIKDAEGHAVARRELFEETGYELTDPLEHLTTFYVSPGGTSERLELYLARVRKAGGIREQTGLTAEAEDIRTHIVPFSEALERANDGRIRDGKTIIALLMLKDKIK